MPTVDQRLDQLEPVISELLARQDETAAKVERVSAQVRQLAIATTSALTAQSDNIIFLLGKTTQIEQRLDRIELRLDKMDERFDKVDERFDKMDQQFGQLGQQFNQLAEFLKDKLK